ncbi:hypothetical protein AB0C14_38710 [Microbispora hainanensis]|uniref:KGGVGR-motif variant AAA ATPase n=1 Tax=Microbispora hainanensis TaxID=568844 RepID=UPI0033D6111D
MSDFEVQVPEHIYTWVDVDAHLATLAAHNAWPDWLYECDAFWDGLEIAIAPWGSEKAVIEWLTKAFGPGSTRVEGDENVLVLDDVPGHPSSRILPITIISRDADAARREPRWRERRIVRTLGEPLPAPALPFAHGIQIAALHSFKGGVGRTLHGVALADAIAQRDNPVLLVDADLEAPGISWMFSAKNRRVDFSYEDFLALLHSSLDGRPQDAVTLGAAYLPNQLLGKIFVLPTRRSLRESVPPRLEPVDLLTPERSMYFVTESLAELAARIGARTVLVDLRAGSSELAAPILLDPRVKRIFVTTISDQSLRGTVRLIRELGRRAPTRPETDPTAAVIITQFREDGHRDLAADASAELVDAIASAILPSPQSTEDLTVDSDISLRPIFSPFQDRLLALPASWDAVLNLVRRQQLPDILSPLAEELTPIREIKATESVHLEEVVRIKIVLENLAIRRELLRETTSQLVYAETAENTDFLATESLQNLLAAHRTEPPLCVVAGAKGSGKTFTQLQMAFRETWQQYAESAGISGVTLDARFAPIFVSKSVFEKVSLTR